VPDAIYTYDAADAVATVSYPKVVAGSIPPLTPPVTTYTYNELGSLMRSVTVNNTDVQFEQRLQYNEGGQILREWSSLMDEERSQYFAYDDVSRLISNNVGGNNTFFEYDHVGNRLETNRLGTYHYTYDAPVGQPRTNRLTSVWTTTNTWDELDYDPDGAVQHRERRYVIKDANNVFDITRHHVLEDFSYDAFNLIEVYKRRRDVASATGGETCTADATLVPYDEWRYRFGPLQEREKKRQYANANGTLNNGLLWTYTLLGADAKQLMTYNGLQADWCGQPAGTVWIWPVEHNSYGPAQSRIIMRPDGTRNVVITDHLGSTRLTLSTDAAPMQSQLHNAFGEVTSDVGEGARTGYIGREHDVESDLGFYGVRLYEPEYGRFMSTDPLWGMYITLQPYQYAGNNPVLYFDKSGFGVEEVNALAVQVHAELTALFQQAVGKLEQSDGDEWYEVGASIIQDDAGKAGLDCIAWQKGGSVGVQLTKDGTWNTPLMIGLVGVAHCHTLPATEGDTEIYDGVPPGASDVFAAGNLAERVGAKAKGKVQFTYSGSVNFAIEVLDVAKAAEFFAESKEQAIRALFAGVKTPEDVRKVLLTIARNPDSGVGIYETPAGEINYRDISE